MNYKSHVSKVRQVFLMNKKQNKIMKT